LSSSWSASEPCRRRAYFIKTCTFSLQSQLNLHQIVTVSLFIVLWIAAIIDYGVFYVLNRADIGMKSEEKEGNSR